MDPYNNVVVVITQAHIEPLFKYNILAVHWRCSTYLNSLWYTRNLCTRQQRAHLHIVGGQRGENTRGDLVSRSFTRMSSPRPDVCVFQGKLYVFLSLSQDLSERTVSAVWTAHPSFIASILRLQLSLDNANLLYQQTRTPAWGPEFTWDFWWQ